MEAFGGLFSSAVAGGGVIYLEGELGAGKTTWARGLLRGLGYGGLVKSPTYTLVEFYSTAAIEVHHFDLYRLCDPEELEFIGIREYFGPETLSLIEWPNRGAGFIPPADLRVGFSIVGQFRETSVDPSSGRGCEILVGLSQE